MLGLWTCEADGTSYGGFRWPLEVGAEVPQGMLGHHLAGLAARGIRRTPLAPGESHAKGLPPAVIPASPGKGVA
ncbi:MAG: hypothetical protein KQJ78_19570 [Deltaproteobacteria bacterium]|nr:hypothetical protein [Deltaproteobacteria bacterium]